jgi:small subunit ribosomal protein S6
MNKYEILYILSADLEDAVREAEIEKYKAIVETSGGEVENVDKWGVKRLAYPINYKTDGFYVLMTFGAAPEIPAELERQMRISDIVVRFLVTRKDK